MDESTKSEILRMEVAGAGDKGKLGGVTGTVAGRTGLLQSTPLSPEEVSKEFENFTAKLEKREKYPSAGEVLRFAKIFGPYFTFDNLKNDQLTAMAKVLGLEVLSSVPAHLSIQLRHHCTKLRREDRDIIWEGLSAFNEEELVEFSKVPFEP